MILNNYLKAEAPAMTPIVFTHAGSDHPIIEAAIAALTVTEVRTDYLKAIELNDPTTLCRYQKTEKVECLPFLKKALNFCTETNKPLVPLVKERISQMIKKRMGEALEKKSISPLYKISKYFPEIFKEIDLSPCLSLIQKKFNHAAKKKKIETLYKILQVFSPLMGKIDLSSGLHLAFKTRNISLAKVCFFHSTPDEKTNKNHLIKAIYLENLNLVRFFLRHTTNKPLFCYVVWTWCSDNPSLKKGAEMVDLVMGNRERVADLLKHIDTRGSPFVTTE